MSTWTPTWSSRAQEEYNSPDLYTSRSAAVSVSPMTSTKRLCSVVSLSAVVPPGDEPAGAVLLACRHSFTDPPQIARHRDTAAKRSEEHTSELQSLMRISYAVFCLQ